MNNNDINNQTENFEIQNSDEDMPVTDDLEKIIEQLPENFPQALPIIQNEIAPIIAECDPGLKDHYISLIKKRTKAASKRAVQLEIENAVVQLTEEDLLPAKEPKVLQNCSQIDFKRIRGKRRKIVHLVEDDGCGECWYTVEVLEDALDE